MPFHSSNDVIQRLTQNPAQLSDAEIIDIYPWMQGLTTGAAHRLKVELALRTTQSIARFDKNSSRVARWSLALNGAMLLLMCAGDIHCGKVLRTSGALRNGATSHIECFANSFRESPRDNHRTAKALATKC